MTLEADQSLKKSQSFLVGRALQVSLDQPIVVVGGARISQNDRSFHVRLNTAQLVELRGRILGVRIVEKSQTGRDDSFQSSAVVVLLVLEDSQRSSVELSRSSD